MILRYSLNGEYNDKSGNVGKFYVTDEITGKSVAVNMKSMDEKVLLDDYDVEDCANLIKICPEIYTALPNKVVKSESNIKRLYKEASQSILNYLTEKNAGLHEIMRAENHAENIRLKKEHYLKRIGVLDNDDEIVRLI